MSSPADFTAAAQALAASVLAAATDPADAIRMLVELVDFAPAVTQSAAPVGLSVAAMQGACGDAFRRAALTALARAASTYQPASYDDAAALRATLCGLLDAEIDIAGDQGEDATFGALRALRAAVVQDMTTRGANLARISVVSTPQPLPVAVIAQRIYRDPTRADELVTQVNVRHPSFMPHTFQALSE